MISKTLINRSLSTISTELEFLVESGVIDKADSQKILALLPNPNSTTPRTDDAAVEGNTVRSTPPCPPVAQVEMVEALYAFQPQQAGDLQFSVGDKIEVLEKPSADWYKGRCNGAVGMFPSNYVKSVFTEKTVPKSPSVSTAVSQYQLGPQKTAQSSSSSYSQGPLPAAAASYYQQAPNAYPPPPVQSPYMQPPVAYQPAPVPYVAQPAPPAQQQAVAVAEPQAAPAQPSGAEAAVKKFGSKLGNAAIFGAGATMGSELVHSIF